MCSLCTSQNVPAPRNGVLLPERGREIEKEVEGGGILLNNLLMGKRGLLLKHIKETFHTDFRVRGCDEVN